MGAPFVSQEEPTLAVEKRLAPVGRNRALPYQELSSHFMLLLKTEPRRFTGAPCAYLTKREFPHAGTPFTKLIMRKR